MVQKHFLSYNPRILNEHERWLKTNGHKGEQADLRKFDLAGRDFSFTNFCKMKIDGHQLFGISYFHDATVPKSLLPWLSSHPRFAQWMHTLTIVDDD